MSDTPIYREWQAPPAACAEDKIVGYLNESVEEGQAWLRAQRGYKDFRKALDTLSGRDESSALPKADYRSRVNPNRLKRNCREVVGALAKLRPFWGYHSDNKAYESQATMMNKVTRALYLEQFFDLRIKDALKYAAATCRGWVVPTYSRAMAGTGRGDIILKTYGSPCVLPNQLPDSGDWQAAYIVHILEEMPVYMAHGMFPQHQDRLRPSSARYWYQSDNIRRSSQGNILKRIFGMGTRNAASNALADLLVPIRRSYIIDLTVNTTGRMIPMGERGSSWYYEVPALGSDIQMGVDVKSGHAVTRKADENDARLYPYRRLVISTDQVKLYDGPGFDWHGMFPGVSFSVDAWPWEPLGFSLVHDGYEVNEAIKQIYRGNMDKVSAEMQPSIAFDTNAIAMKDARSYDPMQPNARLGYDGSQTEGQPFHPGVDPLLLKVNPESMAMIEKLEGVLDDQMAVRDAMALAKLRSAGSLDDMEKVLEANGPIIEEMSRSMEPPMRDLGNMVKYLVLQYMTTSRIMQYVGTDNVTPESFDYDPASLVPSHLPGESPDTESPTSKITRARTFADNLRFFILPNSLHEMSQMVMKLGLIQLKKSNVIMDSQTIAEAWNVPNFGTLPGNTVIERWKAEQEMQLEQAARLKEIGASLTGVVPPGGTGPGKGAPEGRPMAPGAAGLALETKDGGTRSTIASKK